MAKGPPSTATTVSGRRLERTLTWCLFMIAPSKTRGFPCAGKRPARVDGCPRPRAASDVDECHWHEQPQYAVGAPTAAVRGPRRGGRAPPRQGTPAPGGAGERKGKARDGRGAAKAGGTPQRCEKGLDAARAAMPGRLRFAGSAGWQLAGNGAKRHEKSHATTGGHGPRRACRDRQPNNRPCAGYWALRVNQGRYWHATLPPPRRRSVRFRAQRPTEARTARHAVKPVTEQQQPAVAPPRHPRQPQRAAARARGA